MKKNKAKAHSSSIHWFNVDYWMQNGFLLPELGYSALCELVNLGRFESLDTAILEGIRTVLEENTSLLVRSDRKWIRRLNHMDEAFRDPSREKPDEAGAENLRFLNEMYKARAKAEAKD